MNKLQQEIIEIIELFMDKTLSEGCYVKSEDFYPCDYCDRICDCDWETEIHYDKIIVISEKYRDWKDYMWVINWNFTNINKYIPIDWDFKTLWHYDITAVLKFIHSKWYYWNYYSKNCIEFADKNCVDDQEDWTTEFWIKNKPLHLYTEQENISLLKLLWKIVKQ